MRNVYLKICIFLLAALPVFSQDIHFSQFYMSPLTMNPAMTGNYEGTFRIGGIFRTQWFSVAEPYQTPSFYVDAPIITGFRKQDWVGIGATIYQDVSGAGNLTQGGAYLSGTYHIGLDKDDTRVFSIGVQGGKSFRYFGNVQDLKFEDELLPGGSNSPDKSDLNDKESKKATGKDKTDITAGLSYQGVINDYLDMSIGVSVGHIAGPNIALRKSGRSLKPNRLLAHAAFNYVLSDRLLLTPAFLFQKVGPASEAALQIPVGFLLDPEKNVLFSFGPGYRFGDAVEILVGMDYGPFRVGMAYDVNASKFSSASKTVGGIEIAASYIARIYKKPKADNIFFCPRF